MGDSALTTTPRLPRIARLVTNVAAVIAGVSTSIVAIHASDIYLLITASTALLFVIVGSQEWWAKAHDREPRFRLLAAVAITGYLVAAIVDLLAHYSTANLVKQPLGYALATSTYTASMAHLVILTRGALRDPPDGDPPEEPDEYKLVTSTKTHATAPLNIMRAPAIKSKAHHQSRPKPRRIALL